MMDFSQDSREPHSRVAFCNTIRRSQTGQTDRTFGSCCGSFELRSPGSIRGTTPIDWAVERGTLHRTSSSDSALRKQRPSAFV